MDGVSRISEFADRIGLMARDTQDIISLVKVLLGHKATAIQDETRLEDVWKGLSIGILDSEWGTDPRFSWKWGSTDVVRISREDCAWPYIISTHNELHPRLTCTQKERYASMAKQLETLGARVVFPLVDPPQPDVMEHDGEKLHSVACQSPTPTVCVLHPSVSHC